MFEGQPKQSRRRFHPATLTVAMSAGLACTGALALAPQTAAALGSAIATITSCASTLACIGGANTSTGPGVSGTSSKGVGVQASSSSANAIYATNNTSNHATVYAQQSGSGTAVAGLANSGIGVSGLATTGHGISGTATSGYGVIGTASSGPGVVATSASSNGLTATGATGSYAKGLAGDGTFSISENSGSAGVFAYDASGGAGGNGGIGLYGLSVLGTAGYFVNVAGDPADLLDLLGGMNAGSGSYLLTAQSYDGNGYLFLDDTGTVDLSGEIYTGGTCYAGCAKGHVRSYTARESVPTMEDIGRGRLVAGSAYVTLDLAFRNVVDTSTDYAVLVTPEGDSNGVYVAQRTARGFLVQENRAGRSSIAFTYRIVAKPYGKAEPRLPLIANSTLRGSSTAMRARFARNHPALHLPH